MLYDDYLTKEARSFTRTMKRRAKRDKEYRNRGPRGVALAPQHNPYANVSARDFNDLGKKTKSTTYKFKSKNSGGKLVKKDFPIAKAGKSEIAKLVSKAKRGGSTVTVQKKSLIPLLIGAGIIGGGATAIGVGAGVHAKKKRNMNKTASFDDYLMAKIAGRLEDLTPEQLARREARLKKIYERNNPGKTYGETVVESGVGVGKSKDEMAGATKTTKTTPSNNNGVSTSKTLRIGYEGKTPTRVKPKFKLSGRGKLLLAGGAALGATGIAVGAAHGAKKRREMNKAASYTSMLLGEAYSI